MSASSSPAAFISAESTFSQAPTGLLLSKVSDRGLRTYLVLRQYVRPGSQTFPKISTVAERYGLSESYLRRGISELQELGFLVISKKAFAGGMRRVNLYHFPNIPDPIAPGQAEHVKSDRPEHVTSDRPLDVIRDMPKEVEETEVEENTHSASVPEAARAEEIQEEKTKAKEVDPEGFQDFWASYRGRMGTKAGSRKRAVSAYRTALKGHSPEELHQLLLGYFQAKDVEAKTGFSAQPPHAERWLRDARWEDYAGSPHAAAVEGPAGPEQLSDAQVEKVLGPGNPPTISDLPDGLTTRNAKVQALNGLREEWKAARRVRAWELHWSKLAR